MIVQELVTRMGFKTDRAALRRVDGTITQLGQRMGSVGRKMSMMVTAPLLAIGYGILKTAANYEKAMNRVLVLTDATADEFEMLSNQAKELGIATVFTAGQAGDAMGFLAQAGFDVNEIYQAMPATLNLAAASQQDLATTADQLSNIMQGFGLEANEAGRASDVLAYVAASTNTNVSQLAEAMKYAAPVARMMGMSLEEAAALTGHMGNAGIQASMAGTTMRQSLIRMVKTTPAAKKAFEDLGVALTETTENGVVQTRNFVHILGDLERAEASTAQMAEIFGQRGISGISAILQQTIPQLEEFIGLIRTESLGTAAKQADIQLKGLAGEMKKLQSALEGLALEIADAGLSDKVVTGLQKATKAIRELAKTNPEVMEFGVNLGLAAAVLGPLLVLLSKIPGVFTGIGAAIPYIGWFIALPLVIQDIINGFKGMPSAIAGIIGPFEKLWRNLKAGINSVIFGLNNVLTMGIPGLAGPIPYLDTTAPAPTSVTQQDIAGKGKESWMMKLADIYTLGKYGSISKEAMDPFAASPLQIAVDAPIEININGASGNVMEEFKTRARAEIDTIFQEAIRNVEKNNPRRE